MISMITGLFGSTKNVIFAAFAILGGLYVTKQKYNAYQAEDKLKTIENKIAKANVVVAKQTAKAKAKAKEIETTSEIETLRELKEEKKLILKEMDEMETLIENTQKEKLAVKNRKRGKKTTIEV